MIVIVLILIRQRNLSAIKNFYVFIIIEKEYKVNRDTLYNKIAKKNASAGAFHLFLM